jgi:hypothetical protein
MVDQNYTLHLTLIMRSMDFIGVLIDNDIL